MDSSDDIARGAGGPVVERLLTVFSNPEEEFVAEHAFATFDLERFREWFNPEGDPLMYDCYVVLPKDVEFLSAYLGGPFDFDFNRYCYFVEARAGAEGSARR
ncbi:MAG TPA: hypothetical protein VK421_07940 [Pyrinomonadaceae bacterium]|nr:hypothetical protein [Pyrinomonadaceae bacterium]